MMKRLMDVVASLLGVIVLSPVLLLIAAVVLARDGRPVLFHQVRVGMGGRSFRIHKFRTMSSDSTITRELTVAGDPRITRTGAFLRKTKLDELPQLLNVLAGEMSLVGPRPEVPRYVALYTPEQRRVLELRPGITDPASVQFEAESELLAKAADPEQYYTEVIMPRKISLNLEYSAHATLLSDVGVVLRTIGVMLGLGPSQGGDCAVPESRMSE